MPGVISEIRCVFCAGGLVCIKERYYCIDCGERNKLPENLETELKVERADLHTKIKAAKQTFSKKKVRARASRPKRVAKKKVTKTRSKKR